MLELAAAAAAAAFEEDEACRGSWVAQAALDYAEGHAGDCDMVI